jgi:hypothetical protein
MGTLDMKRWTFALALSAALAMAASASAGQFKEFDDNCGDAPYGPAVKMDAAMSDEKVAELRKDILDFIKASDQFQECVGKIMDGGPTFKKEDDTVEKRIAIAKRFEREATKIIDENQSEKERVGDDFNKLIELRKAAKPK